ncbi:MAG: hypothetical protein RIR88_52 [Actinomycetota bacterium]
MSAPSSEASRSLRDRIGGSTAITPVGYTVLSLLAGLTVVTREGLDGINDAPSLIWFVASLCASCGSGVLAYIFYLAIYRDRPSSAPAWVTLMVYAVIGLTYGALLLVIAPLFGLEGDYPLWQRLGGMALLSAIGGVAQAWYFDSRAQAALAREAMIEEAVQMEIAAVSQDELVKVFSSSVQPGITQALNVARQAVFAVGDQPELRRASSQALSLEDTGQITALLLETADATVRPLSATLRQVENARYPAPSFWNVQRNIIDREFFRPLLMTGLYVLLTLRVEFETFGPSAGGFMILTYAIGLWLGLSAGNILMREYPRQHRAIFITSALVVESLHFALMPVRSEYVPGSGTIQWAVLQVLSGLSLIYVISAISAFRHVEANQRSIFAERLEEDKISAMARSRLMVNMAHEMAQVLHGSVQSRLVASALELKRASDIGDWKGVEAALTEARKILDAPTVEVPIYVGTVSDEVTRKISLWESLCSISAEIQLKDDFTGTPLPRLVGRVVEEALSNSIRHGQASTIHVSVASESGSFVTVIVDDNGTGPQLGTPGGGSTFLDQVSGGHWSLKPTAFGTRLTVVLPTGPS